MSAQIAEDERAARYRVMNRTIERFVVPTLSQLEPLRSSSVGDAELARVREALTRWQVDTARSHEDAIQECDKILGTSGVVALDVEDGHHYHDEGIGHCPPFSYCNAGDPYVTTLARDHQASAWVVACWADLLAEYEEQEGIGEWEVFEACPERCPSCGAERDAFQLEFFPGSARGPSFSWMCNSCNHHCFAESYVDADRIDVAGKDEPPTVKIGEDGDGEPACVVALPGAFCVVVNGATWEAKATAEEARRAWLDDDGATLGVEDDDDDGGDVPEAGDER